MRYSIKACLLATLISGVWLAAIASQNPITLEIASLFTVLSCGLAIPLSFVDPNRSRRAFWSGFCSVGLCYFVVTSFYLPLVNTNTAIAEFVIQIPGIGSMPDSTTSRIGTTISAIKKPDGNIGTVQKFYDENITVSIFNSVKQAAPFIQIFVFSSIGGLIAYYLVESAKLENAG